MRKVRLRETFGVETEVSSMAKAFFPRERRRHLRTLIDLPLEYRKVGEANFRGAYTVDVSRMGLLIHSVDHLPAETELEISIFYANGYEFDILTLFARIAWKQAYSEPEWKGYRYGLETVRISAENRRKLDTIIAQQVALGGSGSEELHRRLNSGALRPCVIMTQRRAGRGGGKEILTNLLERHFEKIVFAIILLAILMAT